MQAALVNAPERRSLARVSAYSDEREAAVKIPVILGLAAVGLGLHAQTIRVYVQDSVGVCPADLKRATSKAAALLAPAGVCIAWRHGGPKSGDPDSLRPILVHIVSDIPEGHNLEALAFAQAFEGVHITVLYNRVLKTGPPHVVLGYVLAHEITHLLEGISRHSATGVMKAHWGRVEYYAMRRGTLVLSNEDIHLIRLGMEARELQPLIAVAR